MIRSINCRCELREDGLVLVVSDSGALMYRVIGRTEDFSKLRINQLNGVEARPVSIGSLDDKSQELIKKVFPECFI